MSDYFPKDIIQEILQRLPTKCLIKCTLVCKPWRSLIQSPSFIHSHLRRTIHSNNQNAAVGLLLLRAFAGNENSALYSLYWDNSETGEHSKLVNPYPYIKEAIFSPSERVVVRDFHVVGACNGLVCLAVDFAYVGSQTIIWNPSVRKFVTLPGRSVSVSKTGKRRASYAFGYDSRTNDYKVLRSMSNRYGKTPCEVEIWSLLRGSWKSLSAAVVPEDFMFGVYNNRNVVPSNYGSVDKHAFVNGALHWVQRRTVGEDKFILWFHMGSELFGEIMMPEGLTRERCFVLRYEESLALLKSEELQGNCSKFDIWVMKEHGVVESWTKLFTVNLQRRMLEPFCFTRSGELAFKMCVFGRRLLKVDLKTEEFKYFGIDGYMCHFMDSFVESLVLLGQANAISY